MVDCCLFGRDIGQRMPQNNQLNFTQSNAFGNEPARNILPGGFFKCIQARLHNSEVG